jgi:hypothetical protein
MERHPMPEKSPPPPEESESTLRTTPNTRLILCGLFGGELCVIIPPVSQSATAAWYARVIFLRLLRPMTQSVIQMGQPREAKTAVVSANTLTVTLVSILLTPFRTPPTRKHPIHPYLKARTNLNDAKPLYPANCGFGPRSIFCSKTFPQFGQADPTWSLLAVPQSEHA